VTLRAAIARAGFAALTAPAALRHAAALARPEVAQDAVLRRILRLAADSAYGRHCRLARVRDYREFSAAVPIAGYDDLAPWIAAGAAGRSSGLSVEPALVYERTSGSSGCPKLVPYTASLLASFGACFEVWAHDLARHGPRFTTGRMFCSASPVLQEGERTAGGVPISLADDAAYLPGVYRRLLRDAFPAPPALKAIRDDAGFRRALAAALVADERLEIVSVWSPTYLLAVLECIATRRDEVVADLRCGFAGPAHLRFGLPPATDARLALLAREPIPWDALWPHLKLVSCWTDAASAGFVPALRHAFPTAVIQGKGLLATEAPVTVPLHRAPAPVPLLHEVFLEFEAADGGIQRLHQLDDGAEYGVLLTQSGGMLRYRMHDRVRVEGRCGATPCLRFLGRDGRTSDLVGEKLGEPFVRATLQRLLGDGHCAYLVPRRASGGACGYECVTDHPAAADGAWLAERLDTHLGEAFHYRQARRLGQLRAVTVTYRADARAAWESLHLERGVQWGNIKFEALAPEPARDGVAAVPARNDAPL
jgi:hypothetical protein